MVRLRALMVISALLSLLFITVYATAPKVGSRLERVGDEIVVAGQLFHTGTRVILWTDPSGYDAYRTELRFSPLDISPYNVYSQMNTSHYEGSGPVTYNMRVTGLGLSEEEIEQVRGGGWELEQVQRVVDQFVLHYVRTSISCGSILWFHLDVEGYSKGTFKVLHDLRALSVHFMLDLDGTIYQTLDLKERAWHATTANSRSVGIEISNCGSYPVGSASAETVFNKWYSNRGTPNVQLNLPNNSWIHTPNFVGHPARTDPISGYVRNEHLEMYDYTQQQYDALAHLMAALNAALPRIRLDYPRDNVTGELLTRTLSATELSAYTGVLGHYHVQTSKQDPGPALQWDWLLETAKSLLQEQPDDLNTTPPPSSVNPSTSSLPFTQSPSLSVIPSAILGFTDLRMPFMAVSALALVLFISTTVMGTLLWRAHAARRPRPIELEEAAFTIDGDTDL